MARRYLMDSLTGIITVFNSATWADDRVELTGDVVLNSKEAKHEMLCQIKAACVDKHMNLGHVFWTNKMADLMHYEPMDNVVREYFKLVSHQVSESVPVCVPF